MLPSSPPGAADTDTDAEAYMSSSMFAGVPLPPTTNAGFSDGEEECDPARSPGGFRAIVDDEQSKVRVQVSTCCLDTRTRSGATFQAELNALSIRKEISELRIT